MKKVLNDEGQRWDCLDPTNCTNSDNVVALQWGQSMITMNPIYNETADNPYIPANATSVASWGNYTSYGYDSPPELSAYMLAPYTANTSVALAVTPDLIWNKIFSTSYSWYGFDNLYNVMLLMQDFSMYQKNSSDFMGSSNWHATQTWYNLDNAGLFTIMQTLRQHTMNYLLEGLTKEYLVSDLIQGGTTGLNQKINTGDLLRGNLYIDDMVTPIIPFWQGPASGHNFTMLTGEGSTSNVGIIYEMDNSNYIWLTNQMWDPSTNSFKSVQWVNEANGEYPQFFAAPGYEIYTNFKFRFEQQNTQSMSGITFPHGIESTSLSQYVSVVNPLYYDQYYKKTDADGNVLSSLWSGQFSDQANPGNMFRDVATY